MRANPLLLAASVGLAYTSLCANAQPALTIYNQNFAVIRDTVPLELQPGANEVSYTDATAHVESDSVILRDPSGKVKLQVLEQNYRNDPISQSRLLMLNEGRTIDFMVHEPNKADRIVQGKIIRSGYVPHSAFAMRRYGNQYAQAQMSRAYGDAGQGQPMIEVEGKLQFSLPGEPRFDGYNSADLYPTLQWKLHAATATKLNAELCYVSGGMGWQADYNVVAGEQGDALDLTGWVTVDNQSGKTFTEAKVQLIAGDVNKLRQDGEGMEISGFASAKAMALQDPTVTEKTFDEYHLYSLERPTTLRDRETKQVEFVSAAGIASKRVYVYDGLLFDRQRYGQNYRMENIRNEESFGTLSNTKVFVMREFKNNQSNHLGIPLPKGRVRFYRRDDEQRLQFIGENNIDHTPQDETLSLYTGNAFDIVGERTRTNFKSDNSNHWIDETFEITLRNHKKEATEVRVIEHLYRWTNWEIRDASSTYLKKDAQRIEFRIPLKADAEQKLSYVVHYSW